MRCILTHNLEEQAIFDLAFAAFWAGQRAWMVGDRGRTPGACNPAGHRGEAARQRGPCTSARIEDDAGEVPEEEQGEAETDVQATYSAIEILRRKDFAGYTEEELRAAQRFIDSLAWRLSQHTTRRLERARRSARHTSTCRPPSGAASASGARSSSHPGAGVSTSHGR